MKIICNNGLVALATKLDITPAEFDFNKTNYFITLNHITNRYQAFTVNDYYQGVGRIYFRKASEVQEILNELNKPPTKD